MLEQFCGRIYFVRRNTISHGVRAADAPFYRMLMKRLSEKVVVDKLFCEKRFDKSTFVQWWYHDSVVFCEEDS